MIFPAQRQNNLYNQTPRGDQFLFGPRFNSQHQPIANQSPLHPEKITSIATKGADGLSKTLGNVQQVLQVIQSTAPIVQQYAPMVKNLPALYRMMKAVNEIDDDTDTVETNTDSLNNKNENPVVELKEDQEEKNNINISPQENRRKGTGESKPLLFI